MHKLLADSSVSLWMVVAIVQPLIILSHTACKVIVCYYCVLRSWVFPRLVPRSSTPTPQPECLTHHAVLSTWMALHFSASSYPQGSPSPPSLCGSPPPPRNLFTTHMGPPCWLRWYLQHTLTSHYTSPLFHTWYPMLAVLSHSVASESLWCHGL